MTDKKTVQTKRGKKKAVLIVCLAVLFLCIVGIAVYFGDYYRASDDVEQYFHENEGVSIIEIDDGLLLDGAGTESALIFYLGAKVEYTAYIPLLYRLAENGTDVFLIKMPLNFAIFGMNKADDILSEYDYAHWYIGGHSLGGAMAANYAADCLEDGNEYIEGLVLLAAYPTKSLAQSDMSVLSIYGSEDKVLNLEKVADGRSLMPENSKEIVIDGGNHAQFGCYGEQKGDGTALISGEAQRVQTVDAILEMINAK
jgi:hypothetical protein